MRRSSLGEVTVTRIFIVEDHARFRQVLAQLLGRQEGLEVCGSAESAEEALERILETRADLAIVDVSLPGMNGFDFVTEIRRRSPDFLCVILSGHRGPEYSGFAGKVGARAFVGKSEVHTLPEILRRVLDGESCFESGPDS
jgi:DNA-binding NarL/FixJ family response regulator